MKQRLVKYDDYFSNRSVCVFLSFRRAFVEISVIHFYVIVIFKIERWISEREWTTCSAISLGSESRRERRFSQPVGGDLFIYHRYCGVGVTVVIYMRTTDDRGVKSRFKWVAGTFHKWQKLFFERASSILILVPRRACAYIVSIYIEACHRRRHGEHRQKTKIKKLRNTCCSAPTRHRTNMNY